MHYSNAPEYYFLKLCSASHTTREVSSLQSLQVLALPSSGKAHTASMEMLFTSL